MIGQWFPSISRCTKSCETLRYSGYPQCPKCHARPSMPSQKAPAGTVPPPARRFPRAWVVLLIGGRALIGRGDVLSNQHPEVMFTILTMGHLPVGVSGVANHLKYIIINNLGCDWEFVEMKLQRRAWDFPIAMFIDYSHLLPKTQYVDNGTKKKDNKLVGESTTKKRIEWSKTHCKLKLNEPVQVSMDGHF